MKAYWIKERDNPQLGTYFVMCGLLHKKEAKQFESALYGSNIMHGPYTEEEYKNRIAELLKQKHKVL